MRTPLLILAIAATFVSCKKDDSNNNNSGNNTTPPTAKLSMKRNGTTWTADQNTSASISFRSNDGMTDGAIVSGKNSADGFSFQLTTAREVSGPGTYNLPGTGGGGITFTSNSAAYNVKQATVTITEIKTIGSSKYIKGSFQGTIKNIHNSSDTILITEGTFNGID